MSRAAALCDLRYTICFVTSGEYVLMLNRRRAPNMGLWNGLGGKIEPGETPTESILREVREEAGLVLPDVVYGGVVTWQWEGGAGGMHVFLASVPPKTIVQGVRDTPEGILAWQPLAWVLDPANRGVVSNIRHFLPVMLRDPRPRRFACRYDQERLVSVEQFPLETR